MAHGDETRGHNWRWGAVQIWKRHSTLGWTCSFWILHKGVIWPHHPPLFLVWGPTNFTSPMPSPAVFIRKPPKHFLHYMPHPFSLSKLVTVGDVNPWPWVSNVFFFVSLFWSHQLIETLISPSFSLFHMYRNADGLDNSISSILSNLFRKKIQISSNNKFV